jgi:hypothetical protein
MRKGGAYRPGTRALNWGARDFEHLWVYNIEDFYNFSGDPWIRDCMLFWCEYFTSVQKNVMNDSSIGNMATRGSGHTLSAFLSAMRVTNGAQYLPIADKWVNTIFTRASRTYPKYSVPDGEGPFQLQFLDRAIASYMQMVEGKHPLRWQKGFQVLWGHAEWNTYYANYCYYWRDTGIVSYLLDTIPGGSGGSFAEAMAFISLEAQWRPFVRNLRTVYPSSQMYFNRSVWDGDWMGRPTITWGKRFYNKPNSDTVPPAKINDLSGTGFYGGVKLGFTLPEGARKYHVVWGYKPIKEGPDTLNYRDTLKYFQAYPGGVFEATRIGGAAESVTVDLPVGDTVVYFAVKTLDTINNISPMSNLFRIRHNVVSSEASGNWFAGKQYIMAQPNPFNPVVNIIIKGVSVNKIRRLCVYDVSGKLVADFGRSSSLSWNASGSPSGLYIIRLDTDSRSMTRRIVLAR